MPIWVQLRNKLSKYMYKRIIITVLLISPMLLFGQKTDASSGSTWTKTETKGTISGRIVDANNNKDIEYTNVSIFNV